MSQADDMHFPDNSYVSVFKIDGKPILPPVIDDSRRAELSHDRELAVLVERRLKLKREQKASNPPTENGTSEVDETLVKYAGESISNYDTSAAVDSLLDDNLPTIKDDIVDTMRDADMEKVVDDAASEDNLPKPPCAPLSLFIDSNMMFSMDNLSPSFSLHSSPSLDALNDSRNNSLYYTPLSGRDTFSPTPSGRLIRSNSYTLEKPSPLLLKHMEANGVQLATNGTPLKSPMSMRKNQSMSNIPRKLSKQLGSVGDCEKDTKSKTQATKTSTSARKMFSPISHSSSQHMGKTSSPNVVRLAKRKPSNSASAFKAKEVVLRSIYGTGKSPVSAKKANGSMTANKTLHQKSARSNESISVSSVSNKSMNGDLNGNLSMKTCQEMFAMIEKQHALQMETLMQRQREEQQRMQEKFMREQADIVKKITNLMNTKRNKSTPNGTTAMPNETAKRSNEKMLIEEVNSEVPPSALDTNGNRVNRFTPENSKCIRRLNYEDNKMVLDDLNRSYPSSLSTASSDPFDKEPEFMFNRTEIKAAEKIGAHIKGYLTRRLFQTPKVQDYIKTHRDTLIFLLNLHQEQSKDESIADVELKFHLIQQLASASQNLRNIFVDMPMAERMDIIAKDRERLQLKLNRSKSSDYNRSHMFVNGNSHLARSQSARIGKKF